MNPAGVTCTIHYLLTETLKVIVHIFNPYKCVLNTQEVLFSIC